MNLSAEQIIAILPPMLFLCAFICIPLYNFYKNKGIDPFNFLSIRSIFALINIIYILFALSVGFIIFLGRGIEGEFMLAGLILFGLMQWYLICNDKLAEILNFQWKNIKIILLKSFYWDTYDFTVELVKEKSMVNFYCMDKNNSKFPVFVIREVDNVESIPFFTSLFWENYSKTKSLKYQNILNFAKNNGMIIRESDFNNVYNGTAFEIIKTNINMATEQEIANLPMINVICAKRIKKHIKNEGCFKNFWEFAKVAKLTPNQGVILSKLVYFETQDTKKQEQKQKYDRSLDV